MDEKRTKEIEAAWRKARRDQFFADLRSNSVGLALVGGVIALVAVVFFVLSIPPSLVETLQGRVVGEFAVPSKYSPGQWRVTVQLDGGSTVSMQMPRYEILRQDAPMKVAHLRRVLGPLAYDSFRFAGYAEAAK